MRQREWMREEERGKKRQSERGRTDSETERVGGRRRKRKKETDRVREEEQTVRQREWVR